MFEVIPAIDLLDFKVVRLRQGRYDDVTFYDYSPVELAQEFEAHGASRLHIVDLNGAREGVAVHANIITEIRKKTSLTIEVGGGIRNQETVDLYLSCGVDQVIIGSLFISDFEASADLSKQYPKQVIAGVDAKNEFVATEGWEETSEVTLESLFKRLNDLPLHSVIYTDIAKDGMMQGPNLSRLKEVSLYSSHPIIASGGIRTKEDINEVKEISNVGGCIVGKAILSKATALKDLF